MRQAEAPSSPHGRGIRDYDSQLLARKSITLAGGVAEVLHRVPASEGDVKLSIDRHALFFNFTLARISNDVFYDGKVHWRGGNTSARSCIIPAQGEMKTALRGVGETRYLVLFLHPDSMMRAAQAEHVSGSTLTPFWGDPDPVSWSLAEAIGAECEAGAPHGLLYAETAATMLSLHLLRHHSNLDQRKLKPARGGLAPYQLKRVTEYIGDRLVDELSLEELAGLIGLSPHHFCRAFKHSTGIPPHRWQIAQRVKKAQALMLDTTLSLADIALAAGFSDQSHLTTIFRKAIGTTPNAWRRACRT